MFNKIDRLTPAEQQALMRKFGGNVWVEGVRWRGQTTQVKVEAPEPGTDIVYKHFDLTTDWDDTVRIKPSKMR